MVAAQLPGDTGEATGAFTAEVERLRAAGVAGVSGRLRDLFDYLADRGHLAGPASQLEVSAAVFGQSNPAADDATVRVYMHRLRRRLEEHYAQQPNAAAVRLQVPAGIYALRLVEDEHPVGDRTPPARSTAMPRQSRLLWPFIAGLTLIVGLFAGWAYPRQAPAPANAVWQPLLASERPVLVVLGDYYIYGEIDPVHPEDGRLIRDFRVNSAADLERMQSLSPDRFGAAQDMGLNYLPFSSAYGLDAVVPLLAAHGKEVSLIAASELEPDMLNRFDLVYVGLLSGMGLLEELSFMGSGFAPGESYDQLIDQGTGREFVSGEARSLASPAYYRDYAFLTRYRAPSGALVVVLGGSRDTGLRALGAIVGGADLPTGLSAAAQGDQPFEALFEITGQQGADLAEKLLFARSRADGQP